MHSNGRPLSALQLLECVERELALTESLSDVIKSIAKYRVEADHKVLSTSSDKQSYGEEFELLCRRFVNAANLFAHAVESKKNHVISAGPAMVSNFIPIPHQSWLC